MSSRISLVNPRLLPSLPRNAKAALSSRIPKLGSKQSKRCYFRHGTPQDFQNRQSSSASRSGETPPPPGSKDDHTNHLGIPSSHQGTKDQPLSMLPLSMILRSLATSTVSSSPKLLSVSLYVLRILANSNVRVLNPDRNHLLRSILNMSLYKQFCAGEDAKHVGNTVSEVKNIGFTGAILAYAKETSNDAGEKGSSESVKADKEISVWKKNSLETVRLARTGDFVAFKFTGAGNLAHKQLHKGEPPGPFLADSIDEVCQLARDRGVRVLIDGEQDELQNTIDDWTMKFARKFNTQPGKALIFGTYQAYKKTMPETLVSHLQEARAGNFTLGVKLVRGAYLHSDPPERLQDSKPDTDACYNSAAASVLTREWNSTLPGSGEYPEASIMFATHNATSVRKAYSICSSGRARSEILFAQLQGMADEISCELVEMNNRNSPRKRADEVGMFLPVYKYMAWGTTGECMKYLLRRAEENRDAVRRTREDRDAMWGELVRRVRKIF